MMKGLRVCIDEQTLQARIVELAQEIRTTYGDEPLVLISVLKGAFVFMADLMRMLDMDVQAGFLCLSSYRGEMNRQDRIRDFELPLPELGGRHVLIVEDIFDSGASLEYTIQKMEARSPASLRVCVLLEKEGVERVANPPVDFVGFHIPNEFVVGYGLDYKERYRQLPFIAVVDDPSVLE